MVCIISHRQIPLSLSVFGDWMNMFGLYFLPQFQRPLIPLHRQMRQAEGMPDAGKVEFHLLLFLQEGPLFLAHASVLMHKRETLHDKVVSVFRLSFEGMVDIAEGDGDEDSRILRIKGVRAEKVIERWVEAAARVEDVAVQHEQGDVHFFGGDGFACFVFCGEGGALLVDGFSDCFALSDFGGVFR